MERRFFDIFKPAARRQAGSAPDDCDAIEPLLSLYSDGMTDTAETQRVEAHLATCESCRKAHYWMRATYEVISHRPVVAPPPDLWSRIQDAIVDTPAAPSIPVRVRFNRRPAYALAASIAIAALIVIPLTYRSTSTGSKTITVALNPPSTTSTPAAAPPAVIPSSPTPAVHARVHRSTPPQLASNMVESHAHAAKPSMTQRTIELPKSSARVAEHNLVAKLTPPSLRVPTPFHAPVVSHNDQRVAKVTPERHAHPSTMPTRHDAVPAPAPVVTHNDERVAELPPSTPVVPQPMPAPETQPVVTPAVVHQHHSLNDDLRQVAANMVPPMRSGLTVIVVSSGVAGSDGRPSKDSATITGAAF